MRKGLNVLDLGTGSNMVKLHLVAGVQPALMNTLSVFSFWSFLCADLLSAFELIPDVKSGSEGRGRFDDPSAIWRYQCVDALLERNF